MDADRIAAQLRAKKPHIGTPEWSEWHAACVQTAMALAKQDSSFSYMDFWKKCGMPA